MTIHSLRSKINLIFSVALVLLILLFIATFKYQENRTKEAAVKQERESAHYLYLYYLRYGAIDSAYLESQNIRLITGEEQRGLIAKFSRNKEGKAAYQAIDYSYRRLILINNDRFNLLLENLNKPSHLLELLLLFGGALLLLVGLYWWIIRSLHPLSRLKEKIKTFSQGNLDIECKSDKKDEIAEVANEFDHAVKMIKQMIRSRQLFLRAIMHELKTPIAKGRLVSEMVSDAKHKERLERVFVRLGSLIDEFAKLEQLASKNFHICIAPHSVKNLLEKSIGLLMLDENREMIALHIDEDFILQADSELFPIALKNLLDNAVQYSPNHRCVVTAKESTIVVSNQGNPLIYPIESYFAPFHASENGLGLGLYIVKQIIDIHQMRLDYRHDNGVNIFTIEGLRQ